MIDLKAQLLKEGSKIQIVWLTQQILDQPDLFELLMSYFLGYQEEGYRLPQRAAAVMNAVCEKRPDWLVPYYDEVVANMRKDVHDVVKRNTVRLLQFHYIPEHLLGDTADICFDILNSSKELIAVKVFSMTVLLNIVRRIPELKEELKFSVEEQLPYGSAAFKSRGRKVLKALQEIPNS